MAPLEPAASPAPDIDHLWTVHNSVYTSAGFTLEQDRILRRVWTFVCHESELPEVGSFLTRQVAGDPILVVRTETRAIRAFHNVCRHRGSLVVAEAKGTAKAFRCCYHHWTYTLDGRLAIVPGEPAYEGTGFEKEHFGLLPARLETIYGLVFVCLDATAPSLSEYLGPELIDVMASPLGQAAYEVFHFDSWILKANWKLFAENGRDGYHVPFVHESFLGRASPPQPYRLFPSGHAVQWVAWAKDAVAESAWERTTRHALPSFSPGEGWILNIFPDLVVMARTSVVEILSQSAITHDETFYEVRALGLVGDSEDERASRQMAFDVWLRTQQPEDRAAMENQQRGLASRSMRTSIIARGPDATEGLRGDDNRLRQFWATWRSLMGLPENSVPGA